MTLQEEVSRTIATAVPDARVRVSSPDGEHFSAIVISASFEGQPLLRRHQVVMRALKSTFEEGLHALQLHTFTPAQWAQVKADFPPGMD